MGFEEYIEEVVLQPRSSINSSTDFFVHPKVVASFLFVIFPSSSNLHVDEEPSNAKWKLKFGGQKPNPKIIFF